VTGDQKFLAQLVALLHYLNYSQGGLKVAAGGKGDKPEPASAYRTTGGVSRFGAIPKPTMTVRM
jgi:hypothetical protein